MQQLVSPESDIINLFELTPDLVCIADKAGYFKKVNPAVMATLGYTKEEIFTRPISSFIHPDDREFTRQERSNLLDGKALLNFQNRYITKTGDIIWLEWTSIYLPAQEIVFAIAKDITTRKRAEREIEEKYMKFKNLATHFKSHIEEHRRYLGLELHEELAQLAFVVKMDLDWINSNEQELSPMSKSRAEHALAITELLINTIRRISFSISPNILNDLGLNAAMEWQCKEFAVLNSIPCHFESQYDESVLNAEVRFDFFRICQEALTNIMYHAEATEVRVSIRERDNMIELIISDNGKGFDAAKHQESPGLLSMRGRANSINGQLDIQSESSHGTTIRVQIPVCQP